MADMFEKFTERARQSMGIAQDILKRTNQNQLGTEHLLIGVLAHSEGVVPQVLTLLGIDVDEARTRANQVVELSKREKLVTGGGELEQIYLTPGAKKALDLASAEAEKMNDNYVGTEHILLGILKEGEGAGAIVLRELGLTEGKIYDALKQVRGGAGGVPGDKEVLRMLKKYSRDLTTEAEEGKLDPVIGRDEEIRRVIQVLSRRTKNNPVLIGDPGVGKTAIVEGLAEKIVAKEVPEHLKEKKVMTLDLAGMVAGAKYRGEFEERLKGVVEEIRKSSGDIIVFIDELHAVVGAGAAEGAVDASTILKPALARGELRCIGATTLNEYRKYVEKDAALERRFQPILVREPTVEETIEILRGLRDRYEAHHRVKISDDALVAAATLSNRYISDRFLPDKAIDLMDEAASRLRMESVMLPPDLRDLENKLDGLVKEGEAAVQNREYERAAELRDKVDSLQKDFRAKKEAWLAKKGLKSIAVTAEHVAEVVSSWTRIPVTRLLEEEIEKLLRMEGALHQRVVGQEEAVKVVSEAVRRSRAGLKDPKRPIGSFIFLGPTGAGKTELARALAEFLFDDEDAMIRLDMSEYQERHTVSRMVGAPPGYVGYEEGGQLTESIRRRPYSVILLDEIEKAHPDVFNALLQILEDGRLTDGQGRTVDFKNTIVIMTSNVGAKLIRQAKSLGFGRVKEGLSYSEMKEKVLSEVHKVFSPEFLNRVDEIIVFHALTPEQLQKIVDLLLEKVRQEVKAPGMDLEVSNPVKKILAERGYSEQLGARPLRRTIQRMIENPISIQLLEGKLKRGDTILVTVEKGELVFNRKAARGWRLKAEGKKKKAASS